MANEYGGRYFRNARITIAGDIPSSQQHVLSARSLIGYVRDTFVRTGLGFYKHNQLLNDGTLIEVIYSNGQYQAVITTRPIDRKRAVRVTRIYVRPWWGETFDWNFEPTFGGCSGAVVEKRQLYFSPRDWVASNGDIYGLYGGTDYDRYFGTPCSGIYRNGVSIVTGSNFVGVCVSAGTLIVCKYNGGIIGGKELAAYEIYNARTDTLLHSTGVIDFQAIASFYAGTFPVYRSVQRSVVFNQTGTEGAIVISPNKVLKFDLTDLSNVTSSIEYIPTTEPNDVIVRKRVDCINYGSWGLYQIHHVGYLDIVMAVACDYLAETNELTFLLSTNTQDSEYTYLSTACVFRSGGIGIGGVSYKFSTGEEIFAGYTSWYPSVFNDCNPRRVEQVRSYMYYGVTAIRTIIRLLDLDIRFKAWVIAQEQHGVTGTIINDAVTHTYNGINPQSFLDGHHTVTTTTYPGGSGTIRYGFLGQEIYTKSYGPAVTTTVNTYTVESESEVQFPYIAACDCAATESAYYPTSCTQEFVGPALELGKLYLPTTEGNVLRHFVFPIPYRNNDARTARDGALVIMNRHTYHLGLENNHVLLTCASGGLSDVTSLFSTASHPSGSDIITLSFGLVTNNTEIES